MHKHHARIQRGGGQSIGPHPLEKVDPSISPPPPGKWRTHLVPIWAPICTGGYSDNFIIRRLGSFLGVKILNFNIFWGFQKINIFSGMKILWIYFLGHHKIGLYLVVIPMHFRVFSLGQGTESGNFFGLPKFQILLGCLKFLIFFFFFFFFFGGGGG